MTKMTNKSHVVTGLDIGTTKVACVIGTVGPAGGIEIMGVGVAPNSGMRQGIVINIEMTVEAIKKAREEAELMSGVSISSAWLSVGGTHIESFDSKGMVAIRHQEVNEDDLQRVLEAGRAVAIPADRQILHVLPQDYKIDHQEGISDPLGMRGVRLETSVHMITGNTSVIQNAVRCSERAGLEVKGLVLQQLASALAVASNDEKNLGCAVIDLGGGTCDMISFVQGSVVHTAVIPVGGNNFTHDVAMGLRTLQTNAESLKRKFGCAMAEMIPAEENIEVEAVAGRKSRTIARRELCSIIEARAEETLQLLKGELEKNDLIKKISSGLILTGGGSLLPGLVEMGDFVFDVPVRRGNPERIGGLTDVVRCASLSTAVGLVIYGVAHEKPKATELAPVVIKNSRSFSTVARKIKDYFASVF